MSSYKERDILELKQLKDDLERIKNQIALSRININYSNGNILNYLLQSEISSKRVIDLISRNISLK